MVRKFIIIGIISYIIAGDLSTLTIKIAALRNSKGVVHLKLVDKKQVAIDSASNKIVNNECIITFSNLPKGEYAFQYFHDENHDKELNKNWIGIPKEGFGFSNIESIKFSPPSHKETLLDITSDTTIICKPQYIKK